jgi:hypothetical protein
MAYITSIRSKISSNNSSTTALGERASFTGIGEDVSIYNSITLNIVSSHNSTNKGISVQFSQNNQDWDIKLFDRYIASGNYSKVYSVQSKYFRVVYTNGDIAQNSFRLQSMLNMDNKNNQFQGNLVNYSQSSYDAFSRIRVSSPHTLFQISHNNGKQNTLMCEKLSNGGTSTYLPNESAVDLSVSTTANSEVIRQSREYITYQPGKSLLILLTGVLNSNSNGNACLSRIGYFDDNNGIYFQYTNQTISVVKRSRVSGSVVNTIVNQSEWNIDSLDGSGISGMIIDPTKAQIFIIDLEWLGVGRVRCGIDYQGTIYYCHQFINSNINTTTYMTRATLPIRYQINNTGTSTGSGKLKMICSTVASEGGYNPLGRIFSAGRGNGSSISVSTTLIPLMAIRLKSEFNRVNVKLYGFSLLSSGNTDICLYLYHFLSPSSDPLTNERWVSAGDESSIEYDISSTALSTTNGLLLFQNYLYEKIDYNTNVFDRTINITSNIDGVSDIIVLAGQKLTNGRNNVFCSLQWTEYQT